MGKLPINEVEIQHVQAQIREHLQRHWQLFFAEGIVFMMLGFSAIAIPQLFSVTLIIFFGWIFLLGGVVHVIRTIRFPNMPGTWLWVFMGVIQLLLGYGFISQPIAGVQTVTMLMALFFAFEGAAKMAFAAMMRPLANWGYVMFSGFTALVLAVVIWLGWPQTSGWVLGVLIGINMVLLGWSVVKISWHHKDIA